MHKNVFQGQVFEKIKKLPQEVRGVCFYTILYNILFFNKPGDPL